MPETPDCCRMTPLVRHQRHATRMRRLLSTNASGFFGGSQSRRNKNRHLVRGAMPGRRDAGVNKHRPQIRLTSRIHKQSTRWISIRPDGVIPPGRAIPSKSPERRWVWRKVDGNLEIVQIVPWPNPADQLTINSPLIITNESNNGTKGLFRFVFCILSKCIGAGFDFPTSGILPYMGLFQAIWLGNFPSWQFDGCNAARLDTVDAHFNFLHRCGRKPSYGLGLILAPRHSSMHLAEPARRSIGKVHRKDR
ncbi:hypothetical protein OKW30_001195 [Paraburkholderia sp. Clong3]